MPKSVSSLDDGCLSHQEVQLFKVAESFVVSPSLLDHDSRHHRSTWALVHFLGVFDDAEDLSLVGDTGDEVISRVSILVHQCVLNELLRPDISKFDDILPKEFLELRNDLRYGTPHVDVLSFEFGKLFSVLLHDAAVDQELRITVTIFVHF